MDVSWPSSLIRDETLFPCIARWIPNHWTTREDIFLEYFQTKLRHCIIPFVVVVVQWLSHVRLFMIPWTAARQASLPFTISQSLLKLIQASHPLSLPPPSIFPSIRVFSNESALQIRYLLTYWSFRFSISPSNEYSRVDFLKDWLVWSANSPRDSQESSLALQFEGPNSLVLSLLYGPSFTSIHDYWKNHSFDYIDLCYR